MPNPGPLEIVAVNPATDPGAIDLIRRLSAELAVMYDFADDGSAHFSPSAIASDGSGSVFLVGRETGLGGGGAVDGRPVACGAFVQLEPGTAEIKRMFVAPDCRGRGYSRLILADLERRARAAGYSVARLETGNRNHAAIGLYASAGYHRIEKYGIYANDPRSVCFEKRLA